MLYYAVYNRVSQSRINSLHCGNNSLMNNVDPRERVTILGEIKWENLFRKNGSDWLQAPVTK